MENVINILRRKLRNERIFLHDAIMGIEECKKSLVGPIDSFNAFTESKREAEKMIPQLEKAIKILSEWKDK